MPDSLSLLFYIFCALFLLPYSLFALAFVASGSQYWSLAELLYSGSIPLFRLLQFMSVNSYALATAQINLAYVRRRLGRDERANIPILTAAADIFAKRRGPNCLPRARALLSLQTALNLSEQYAEATRIGREALQVFETGEYPYERGVTASNLSCSLLRVGQPRKAKESGEQAVKCLGAIKSRSARTQEHFFDALTNLAAALSALREHEQAIEKFTEALQYKQSIVTGKDPSLILAYVNLGRAQLHSGDDEQATKVLCEAQRLADSEVALAVNDRMRALLLTTNGQLSVQKGDWKSGEALMEKAAAFAPSMKKLEQSDLFTALGKLHAQTGNFVESDRWFAHSISLLEELAGPDNPMLVRVLLDYARSLQSAEIYDKAEGIKARALQIMAVHQLESDELGLDEIEATSSASP